MESIIAVVFVALYAVLDGLADAFIFRSIRQQLDVAAKSNVVERISIFEHGALWIPFLGLGIFDVHKQASDYNTNWHRAQAAQQAAVILAAAYLSGCWQVIPLGAALFWLIHDGIVNRLGLDRPFFFVGTTAWIDRMFQRLPNPELFMAIAKFGLLAAGVALFLIL